MFFSVSRIGAEEPYEVSAKMQESKIRREVIAIAIAVVVVALLYFLLRSTESSPIVVVHPAAAAAVKPVLSNKVPVWTPDPMAVSHPDSAPLFIVQRQKKMQALMTASPPHYYTMKLLELRELARKGDAHAMMQLAEQYISEDARLRSDPGYPVGENTRELAKQYLSDAFLAGRIRAAALLSKQLFDENQVGEAYAWRLVSERFGDAVNPLWERDTNQYASMSDNEKNAALVKARAIADALLKNKMREYQNLPTTAQ